MSSEREPRRDPWRAAPVLVGQIPEAGLHREIEADAATRAAIAEIADVREVASVKAWFDVTLQRDGQVHIVGGVKARIGQVCVVSLDPMETELDEPIDQLFAPPDQIPELADTVDDNSEIEAEMADPPEPIVNGQIDLARLATDALFLGIDPYPRKPGAVFETDIAADDPVDHPFAALKALKTEATPGKSGSKSTKSDDE
jgi:uncharacterized metal-binding protein YceD (DUF177 family)